MANRKIVLGPVRIKRMSDELLQEIDKWVSKAEQQAKFIWDAKTESSKVVIPFDLWDELGSLLGYEDDFISPRDMGWVGHDGLP